MKRKKLCKSATQSSKCNQWNIGDVTSVYGFAVISILVHNNIENCTLPLVCEINIYVSQH
jgi:hypothetical protein